MSSYQSVHRFERRRSTGFFSPSLVIITGGVFQGSNSIDELLQFSNVCSCGLPFSLYINAHLSFVWLPLAAVDEPSDRKPRVVALNWVSSNIRLGVPNFDPKAWWSSSSSSSPLITFEKSDISNTNFSFQLIIKTLGIEPRSARRPPIVCVRDALQRFLFCVPCLVNPPTCRVRRNPFTWASRHNPFRSQPEGKNSPKGGSTGANCYLRLRGFFWQVAWGSSHDYWPVDTLVDSEEEAMGWAEGKRGKNRGDQTTARDAFSGQEQKQQRAAMRAHIYNNPRASATGKAIRNKKWNEA